MTFLAIDQGTTSTRAVVFPPEGREAEVVASRTHRQSHPHPGWVEHDPEELIAHIRHCLKAALDQAPDCHAMGIDNQGESCLAWDRVTTEPLSPVIVWQDSRTTARIEALMADGVQSDVLARCGLPLDPYFSASKLAWLLDHNPVVKKAYVDGRLCLGTTDAFFLHRLTGHCVTDVTTASRTALMNLRSGEWDPELCALFGVPMECLPEIVPTTGDFGAVRLEDGRVVPVRASVVDQQAALYGHGCRAPGAVKMTFGTGAFALAVTGDQPVLGAEEQGLLPTVAWQYERQPMIYALDGGVYCAASALNWARDLGLFTDFAEIAAFDGPSAAERGLFFVPALSGLACPHWDRGARGSWMGLGLDTTGQDMVRAVLEGVALRAVEVLSALATHTPMDAVLSIDGGMAQNGYFQQFLADALGQSVMVQADPEVTALGTAQLVAMACDRDPPPLRSGHRVDPVREMGSVSSTFAQCIDHARALGITLSSSKESGSASTMA